MSAVAMLHGCYEGYRSYIIIFVMIPYFMSTHYGLQMEQWVTVNHGFYKDIVKANLEKRNELHTEEGNHICSMDYNTSNKSIIKHHRVYPWFNEII